MVRLRSRGRAWARGEDSHDDFAQQPDPNEWDAIALGYTSGTTGNPKGVVYAPSRRVSERRQQRHRRHMPASVYLWTLPMFHCNGWCFPWTIAARAGVNVCLRKVDPAKIFELIPKHGVTHYVRRADRLFTLINAPERPRAAARIR
jgi:fatty-acyl-CoA synthase